MPDPDNFPSCFCFDAVAPSLGDKLAWIYCATIQGGGGGGTGNVSALNNLTNNSLVIGQGGHSIATTSTASGILTFINSGRLQYSNLVAATAASKILGRTSASAGDWQEITLGTNLSMSGTTLNASGGGGTPGGANTQVQFNDSGSFGAEAAFNYDKTTNTLSADIISCTDVNASGAMVANTLVLATDLTVNGAATITTLSVTTATATTVNVTSTFRPDVNGAVAIGDATHQWNGIFLFEGSAINWDNGDATLTQSGNTMTWAGISTMDYGSGTLITGGQAILAASTSLLLGTAGSAVGSVGFRNATSGTITVAPPTGALGTVTQSLQAVTGTIYCTGGTDVAVADGGTGLSSGTSGGVLAFTAAGTLASSGALAANAIVIGGGAGAAPSTTTTGTGVLTLLGNAANGSASDGPGYRGAPQNSQSAAYTTVMADNGKHILHPAADNNARTFTIDSNANVAYPIGATITFINEINTVTIAITSDTLVLAGAGTTGSRTLAANGIATAVKKTSTSWIINGTGLT